MAHDHSHHQPEINPANMNKAFIAGIVLNFSFVIIEAVYGFLNHSLSLLSDAGHNLADVASLGLSLFAYKMLSVKPNDRFTYGFRKTSVLVALFNAVVLLISVGIIAYEGFRRLFDPVEVKGLNISIIAGIGILINFSTALLFFRQKKKDINIRAAYLHLLADAVVSLGIVIAGILIYYFHWLWIDPLVSIIIAVVILISTWQLLKHSLYLSLDGVPEDINIAEVREIALAVKGVQEFSHIHIWAMSTTENALTAHIRFSPGTSLKMQQQIKKELRHELLHKNIHHVTVETNESTEPGKQEVC